MGNRLEEYPDLMTKEEVAKYLRRFRPSMVPRLIGLKKARIGNGRGKVLYRKEDVREYVNSKVEREEVIKSADQQKERYRKMGVSSLISREELQKARLGYAGGGS
jgi:23S rRNA pseudoU1915 N3-methylase RlmH